VLEARAPTTAPRDVKPARIVLLAAEGRSTRSIAEEVGVSSRASPATGGGALPSTALVGSRTAHARARRPIYGKATNKRILVLLEKPPLAGYARWTGPLLGEQQAGSFLLRDTSAPKIDKRNSEMLNLLKIITLWPSMLVTQVAFGVIKMLSSHRIAKLSNIFGRRPVRLREQWLK
jgi:hypothetical protein